VRCDLPLPRVGHLTARRDVRQGTSFSPAIAARFREVIADAIDDADIKGLVDDVEDGDVVVDLAVHEPVPEWAMDALPDALLNRLPSLPAAVEYRIVSGSLVLWDTHAEILIDALPGAFVIE
jgi:hypothetical protein